MPSFIDEQFLLTTRASRRLYHEHAEGMPILDFHCHLPARDIAENRGFASITDAWLAGDHYKWRAMRACGIPERLVTGEASDREKFLAWAETVPRTIGNPLYHWTHLELKRYFDLQGVLLSAATASSVYDRCSSMLSREDFHVRALLTRMNVRVICTTDDPVDDLAHHAKLNADASFPVTVVPTFRPDEARGVENPPRFNAWVDRLSRSAGIEVREWTQFTAALRARHESFHAAGCRASDHGLEEPYAEECTDAEASMIFQSVRGGASPGAREARAFKSAVMRALARMDAEKGWVQQLHMGALRDVNSRFLARLGSNTGFDVIGDFSLARPLVRYLDSLEAADSLPKTILYCLNPADNAMLAVISGSFPQENVRGRIQFGAAWWFNDQKQGMEEHLRTLMSMGLLANFVGMLTDSRSFLSYPRHEYFRRILCAVLGSAAEAGELPRDFDLLGGIVRSVCWNNAESYFRIPFKEAQRESK
ncbi:MAG: glucuronate isomerase [Spirochaetia bacterium]|jgi:glucuronate isomerase